MSGEARFLTIEAVTSGAINAVLSLAFAAAVFAGKPVIPATGAGGFAPDVLPQTFMVTLMGAAVPSLIVRARLRAGRLPGFESVEAGPLWRRALVAAIVVTLVVGGGAFAISLAAPPVSFPALLALKAAYGAALGATITIWALRKLVRSTL